MLAEDMLSDPGLSKDPLVVELLVRAIDLAAETDHSAAASACLALTDPALARSAADRAWLHALAVSLDPTLAPPSWISSDPSTEAEDPSRSYTAALALARMRNGDPRRAALVLDEPGVLPALTASSELAVVRGPQPVLEFFDDLAEGWPCPVCRGERFEATRTGTETVHARCPHCAGDPGPRFATTELILLLRAELALVGGGAGSWSAALTGAGAAPLRAPDPDNLATRLGVSTAGAYWRDGRWTDDPG